MTDVEATVSRYITRLHAQVPSSVVAFGPPLTCSGQIVLGLERQCSTTRRLQTPSRRTQRDDESAVMRRERVAIGEVERLLNEMRGDEG